MFTEAMKIVLLFIMQNHLYTFVNQLKLQSEGGPIGLELTGVLAQLFMVRWDRQMAEKLEENGIGLRMYKRYVDDISNGNRTEWSPIQSVIIRVITKSDDRAPGSDLFITSMITD